MKNSLRTLLTLGLLVLIAVFVYRKYQEHNRYDHISRLDYLPYENIDYNFYDQPVVQAYLNNCNRLTDMRKATWLTDGVDIQNAKEGYGEVQSKINQYKSLLSYTKVLESKLIESKDLKDQGLTNDMIEMILDKGITIGAVENERDKMAACDFLKGKNVSAGSKPTEIWELQKLLNSNDYKISINGVFSGATDSALVDFQNSNNLYPSHVCDDITLRKLAE